ncbi:MAG: glycoside hydrolase family 88 protein [Melioribacteraceae bacterium]|nr:glycoside hydrolase family 88 protein [Melioribacteraceae bacterium]
MIGKILLAVTIFTAGCSYQQNTADIIKSSFDKAAIQYSKLFDELPDTLFPRSIYSDGSLWTNESGWWTSGFFPGSLWYLYEYGSDDRIKNLALQKTMVLDLEKYNYSDHDIGFKIFCSYGNALRLTTDSSFTPVIIDAAYTLMKRYKPDVGCFRSWDDISDSTEYLVIVDNMMNLELLFWAFKQTGDSVLFKSAVSHADKTMQNHYRRDGSCYHVLSYNQQNGGVKQKKTAQGYSDESSWTRGQAWGLYGFTMAYRETGLKRYLDHSQKIALFFLNHPRLPIDKIPYWDFDSPDIPDTYRDASAAAITASALIELAQYSNDSLKSFYLDNAEIIITVLSSPDYRTSIDENFNFLLKHGVGHLPANSEVDVPLSYADYYYLEAMSRLLKFLK